MQGRLIALTLLVAATGFSCGTEPEEVEETLVYEATSWQITGAVEADALAEGATLDLVLERGGFVDGTLFMPASITGGAEVMESMAGTWNARGDTVRFNQVRPTFVGEVPWILTTQMLTTADSVDGSFYDIELTRVF